MPHDLHEPLVLLVEGGRDRLVELLIEAVGVVLRSLIGIAYRVGRVPRNLVEVGDRQENRYGRLGREYGKISFDKKLLPDDPALERVTPGYPLFEAVRRDFLARTENHVQRGAVFYDLHLAPVVRDDQVQRIAVEVAIKHERERGWEVESVESENRGFDLISRRPHPEDPKTFIEVRFIEVKGRAGVGVVALSENEYRTAERLKGDFWLYAVFNCAGTPYRPKPCPAGMAVDYDGGTLPAWPSEHPASRKEQGLIHVKPDSRHR